MINDADVTTLNGRTIGKTGEFPPEYKNAKNLRRLYFLGHRDEIVGKELLVQVYSEFPLRRGMNIPQVRFGEYNELRGNFFWKDVATLWAMPLSLVVLLFTVLILMFLFLEDPSRRHRLLASMAALLMGLYTFFLSRFSYELGWSNVLIYKGIVASAVGFSMFFAFYSAEVVRSRVSLVLRVIGGLSLLLLAVVMLEGEILGLRSYYQKWYPLFLSIVLLSLIQFSIGLKKGNASQRPLLVGTSIFLLMGVHDILIALNVYDAPNLTRYGLAVFSVSFIFSELVDISQERSRNQEYKAVAKTTQLLAHDIRKPFSILKLLLDALRMPMQDEEKSELLNEGIQEVDSALASVNGLLEDLMAVGARNASLTKEWVALDEVLIDILNEQARLYPKAKVEVSLTQIAGAEVYVDRTKIKRVFSNIVLNAIQAMRQEGKIEIRTSVVESGARISIRNFGSYIPAKNISRIFDTFYTSQKKGGTGLGLAIAKKWVEAHNGVIFCESEKAVNSQGSWVSFEFSIPDSRRPESAESVVIEKELVEYLPLNWPPFGRDLALCK